MKVLSMPKLLILMLVSHLSMAQKELNLTLKYDTDFQRYEVYAKPSFSQQKFTWGPSQITVVLPSNVLIQKLDLRNSDGGIWEDNSVVIAPEAMSEFSFHGIATSGSITNLVENNESLLFYFYLPKEVDKAKVRLFDNTKDPNSAAKGMMGGDFRHTVVDATGNEIFKEVYANTIKTEEKSVVNQEYKLDAAVYPNIVTDKRFKIGISGLNDNASESMTILYDVNGKEVFRTKAIKVMDLQKQVFELPKYLSNQILHAKIITNEGSISKKIVVE